MDGHSEQAVSQLWHYALQVYADPAVATACLHAQDVFGVDVNLLLCAAWCASRGQRLELRQLAALDEHCRGWREQVITPLRRQRRNWKDDPAHREDYASIKRLELEAEREQLSRLERAVLELPSADTHVGGAEDPALLRANLALVCEYFDAGARAADPLVNALTPRV